MPSVIRLFKMYLKENIKGICQRFGLDYREFLDAFEADEISELTLYDLEAVSEEYEVALDDLLFKRSFPDQTLSDRMKKIKLLMLDVDGVMTDGGMYFTESGDQMKKFNTKDGMAILHLTSNDFQVAIISSGFRGDAVKRRADMLGIQHCSVSRESKITRLANICATLRITHDQVAIIGDDINDLEIMRSVGVSFCPSDAVKAVKDEADVILSRKGGEGCVREMIDNYLLDQPLTK